MTDDRETLLGKAFDNLTLSLQSKDGDCQSLKCVDEENQAAVLRLVTARLRNPSRKKREKKQDLQQLLKFLHFMETQHVRPPTKTCNDDPAHVDAYVCWKTLVEAICENSLVKEFVGREDTVFTENNFKNVGDFCVVSFQCLFKTLSFFNSDCVDSKLKQELGVPCLRISIEHSSSQLWSSEASVKNSSQVLALILSIFQTSSIKDLLLVQHSSNNSVLSTLLADVKKKFTKARWKQCPSIKVLYHWCLFNVGFPNLSDYIADFLPGALLLVDDHETGNKVLGIKCLHHILENCSKAELLWYSRAEVIYDSLEKLAYNQEPEILRVLHPCLLKVLSVLEPKLETADVIATQTRHNTMFQRLLNSMEHEDKIVLRHIYSEILLKYVQVLGLTCMKHLAHIFRVASLYLEVYDGPTESSRLNVLACLQKVILECWPRIPFYCEMLMRTLGRLLCDLTMDKTTTPNEVQEKLLMETKDTFVLLKRACATQGEDMLRDLATLDFNPDFHKLIVTVMEAD